MRPDNHHNLATVIDIETLGTSLDAVILSIGAVIIDLKSGNEIDSFYTKINSDQDGRKRSSSTIEWWQEKRSSDPDAYRELFIDTVTTQLPEALMEFRRFIIKNHHSGIEPAVYGNGPEFDNAILENAFIWNGIEAPWKYYNNHSIRTAHHFYRSVMGHSIKHSFSFVGIVHHALHDARHEAKQLQYMISHVREYIDHSKQEARA